MVMKARLSGLKVLDRYRIDQFYRNYAVFVTPNEFVSKSVAEAKKADVIHIHSVAEMAIKILKYLRKIQDHYPSLPRNRYTEGFHKDKVKDSYLRNIITPKKLLKKIPPKTNAYQGSKISGFSDSRNT